MSVCLSVRTEQLGSHWTDCHEILYLIIFRKSVDKNSGFVKIRQEQRILYVNTYAHLRYLAEFLLE